MGGGYEYADFKFHPILNHFHERNYMSDKAANYISQGMQFQIKMMKVMGWVLIILGIPLMFLIVGFAMIPIGILCVWQAGRLKKKSSPENIKSHLDGIGAVVGEIRKGANGSSNN